MKISIKIQNIKCGGCSKGITSKLSNISGIDEVDVDHTISEVNFSYTSANDLTTFERALIQMGYPPEGIDNPLSSKAKSFMSCAVGKLS